LTNDHCQGLVMFERLEMDGERLTDSLQYHN